MFGIDFKKFFARTSDETEVLSENIAPKDKLYIELSNEFIAYRLNDDKIESIEFDFHEDCISITNKLQIWSKHIETILSKFEDQPSVTIFVKSSQMIVKNSDKSIIENEYNQFFASKMALDSNDIRVLNIEKNSYLIVKNSFLEQILFLFKGYHIDNIYDTSLLNTYGLSHLENVIYLDISLDSVDMIYNDTHHVQKRNLNITLFKLLDSCTKALYVDFETAYKNLLTAYTDIRSYKDLEATKYILNANIESYIELLAKEIQDTLSYFTITSDIKHIDTIFLNGDVLNFDFIRYLLQEKLGIRIVTIPEHLKLNTINKTNLTFFEMIDKSNIEQLNISLDGLNYNDGKDEYIFIENRFIKDDSATQNMQSIYNSKNKVRIDGKNKQDKFHIDKPFWKMDMEELFEFLKFKAQRSMQSSNKMVFSKGLVLGLIGVLISVTVLIYGAGTIMEYENNFDNDIYTLEDRIKRVDNLKKVLISKNQQIVTEPQDVRADKIFWTQKLITLADLMPNEIWLSSITLDKNSRNIEDKQITSDVMVLEARALPSAMGHVSNIAFYMNKLLNADDDFRKDFSNIYFGGAKMVNEYGYDVINFKLLCNFEKNVNIAQIEKEQKMPQKKNIAQNLKSITDKAKLKEKLLENIR